ncbi:MAG: hypothetical protein HY900_04210 [Deltaproteobacteria bacterium]|nr:hypothetical protein [Deltaproteobacteria bacterium]
MAPWHRTSAAEKLEKQDRRGGERRLESRYRFLERRSGFDRRALAEPRTRSLASLLAHLHRTPRSFLFLLLAVNLLNAADYACTLVALKAGVQEANPFMAALFAQGPAVAGFTKVALVGLVTGLLWTVRRFRNAILAALFMAAGLLGVFAYHLFGLAVAR